MKYKTALLLACAIAALACNKEPGDKMVADTVEFTDTQIVVEGLRNNEAHIGFKASSDWVASLDCDWATVFPMAGTAGETDILLIAKSSNISGENRECRLTIECGKSRESISIVQEATEVLLIESSEINVSPEGEEVHIRFSSNVSGHILLFTYTDNVKDWILPVKDANTKALQNFEYILQVTPNPDHDPRSAEFYIEIVNPQDMNQTYIASEIISINQEGVPVDTSTDYSADGKWRKLFSHSTGNGVPIVIMGDGFADKDIESKYYDSIMDEAAEHLFSEEPMKSLKEFFDVYAVTAVSENNAFGSSYNTCFECEFDEQGSSRITGNENKVLEYIFKVPELASMEKLCNTLSIVILNSGRYAGTTGFGFSGFDEFGLAYCPVVNGSGSERFRSVLVHEAIGHGFAKLYDEYAYETYGNISVSTREQVLRLQNDYGWAANVSVNYPDVPWKHMLSDSRYAETDAYGERLGIYEGACTYWTGAWRPTDDSMMRNNTHGFNAPSREAIYKRTMKSAFGSEYVYDYEDFAAFDMEHLPQPSAALSEQSKVHFEALPAPYIAGKPVSRRVFNDINNQQNK